MRNKVTKEKFLEDVKDHKLNIVADDGISRHLHLSSGSFNQYFDIVTYKGNLVISGDMGCFVFARVDDMFRFFRSDELSINAGYLGEKLQSLSRWGGYLVFSEELMMESVESHINDICADIGDLEFDKDEYSNIEEVKKAFRDEVEEHFKYADLDQHRFIQYIDDFKSEVLTDITLNDDGCYEWLNTEEYSYQYLWCCHAIVWAIQQYDAYKLENKVADD